MELVLRQDPLEYWEWKPSQKGLKTEWKGEELEAMNIDHSLELRMKGSRKQDGSWRGLWHERKTRRTPHHNSECNSSWYSATVTALCLKGPAFITTSSPWNALLIKATSPHPIPIAKNLWWQSRNYLLNNIQIIFLRIQGGKILCYSESVPSLCSTFHPCSQLLSPLHLPDLCLGRPRIAGYMIPLLMALARNISFSSLLPL